MISNTILVVDDSPTSRLIVIRCFQMAGWSDARFIESGDGVEAIAMIQAHHVDLVVTDLQMPRMDGETFIEYVGNMPGNSRPSVVVVSSTAQQARSGFHDSAIVITAITKPISPEKVIRCLGERP